MNTKTIDNALLYYDIIDEDYKNQCYDCLKKIKQNAKLQKEFNDLFNAIFVKKSDEVKKLWNIKSTDLIFSENVHPYITNLLLLRGYKIHQKNIDSYKLDEQQIYIHKLRVKETLTNDIKIRNLDGIRISQMLWGSYFVNLKLIEIGRLQFEYEDSNSIKIHIPAGEKLDIDKVIDSLNKAEFFIKKYFKIKNYCYYCNSWLLSKQIHNIVSKDSNIYKFYNLFDVTEGENCIEDILNFVYKKLSINNYCELQDETSLQRNIKSYLLNNNDIKLGKGTLKKNIKVNGVNIMEKNLYMK